MKLLNGINGENSARTGHYGNVARHWFCDDPSLISWRAL